MSDSGWFYTEEYLTGDDWYDWYVILVDIRNMKKSGSNILVPNIYVILRHPDFMLY